MNLTINQRFELLLKALNHNPNSFAVALEYPSNTKIQRLTKEPNKPSIDILNDISNKFDNVNIDWIVTGKGEMFKSKAADPDALKKCEDEKNRLVSVVLDQTDEIKRLKRSVKYDVEQLNEVQLNEPLEKYKQKKK